MTRRPRLKVLVPILIVALLALFAAVGAVSTLTSDRSADSVSRDTIDAGSKSGAGAAQLAPELAAPDQSTASSDGGYAALPDVVPSGSHYLIRNGSLSLVVRDGTLMTTVQRITVMTQGMGGYVMASAMGTTPAYPGPVEPLAYGGAHSWDEVAWEMEDAVLSFLGRHDRAMQAPHDATFRSRELVGAC